MKKKTTILLLAGSLMIAGIAALLYQSQNSRNQIRHYTAFFSTTGEEITSDNDMKKKIAEQIGADCEETWLKGQTKDNALNAYIAAGEYPDFISGESKLYDAGALIPIDEYWDNYPNIKNYLTFFNFQRVISRKMIFSAKIPSKRSLKLAISEEIFHSCEKSLQK